MTNKINLSDTSSLHNLDLYLQNWANNPDFLTNLQFIFGDQFTIDKASYLQQQWSSGNYQSLINDLEIRESAELGGANGAYATSTGTIYLAQQLIDQNSPTQITAVLLEEYGHAVDNYLNSIDTMGDEGRLFSAVVRGESLTVSELNSIKQEDDHAIVTLNGQQIEIEMSATVIEKNYGGTGDDYGTAIRQTTDGNFIIAASLTSSSGDGYLLKVTPQGNVLWSNTYGGAGQDWFEDVKTTSDGGYIAFGNSTSYGSNRGKAFLVKTDSLGNQQWYKTYGGPDLAYGNSVQQTSDGGYILVGSSTETDASLDIRLTKVDANGNEQWTQFYGRSYDDTGIDVKQSSDGGYIIVGRSGAWSSNPVAYVIKTDSGGNKQWERTFGGTDSWSWDTANWVEETGDHSFVLVGNMYNGSNQQDVALIKLDNAGNTVWTQLYGGGGNDAGFEFTQLTNGGFAIAGYTTTVTNNQQAYLLTTDSNGNLISSQTFSGLNNVIARSIQAISDTSFVLTGYTNSSAGSPNDVYFLNTNNQTSQHTYYLTNAAIWADAQAQAVAMGGNLVTINDAAENQFLVNAFGSYSYLWTGFNDIATEGNWQWVNGEPVTYTNWQPGEPNNGAGGEQQDQGAIYSDGTWDDGWGYSQSYRGIVEVINGTSTISLQPTNITETEGNKQVTFTVTLNGVSPTKTFTVDYSTADGTAQAGSDYTATNGTLTFNPGESSKTFTVSLLDDNLYEGDETFNLTLSNPTGGAVLGTQTSASLTIHDNDLKISLNDLQVIEGINSTAKLTVSLNQSSSLPVKVDYSTADDTAIAKSGAASAIALSDYTSTTGTLTFNPGVTTQTITIPILNDNISESIEQFFVNLSNPVNASINDNQGIVTVSDTLESAASKTLPNSVENLTLTGSYNINGSGNASDNLIIGNSGNNILNGSTGIDTLIGGLGNDVYYVDNTSDSITENFTEGTDLVYNTVDYTLAANLENLTLQGTSNINGTGNDLNNSITGNSGNNTLTSGVGNDTLNGSTGIDTLIGGLGNDVYVVDTTTDTITENLNEGTDQVNSSVTYTLGSNVENLTLTGTSNINGTGNALNNSITGNTGHNTLTGSTGSDTLIGGLGNDIYRFFDNSSLVSTTRITETSTGGLDTLDFSGTNSPLRVNLGITTTQTVVTSKLSLILSANNAIENAIGGKGGDRLIGNALDNNLTGGAGNDQLVGSAGNDSFIFRTGKAFATADLGIDTLTDFSSGSDKIVLSKTTFTALTGDSLTEFATVEDDSLVGNSTALIVYSESSSSLYYNQNGAIAGLGSGAEFAFIGSLASLTANDFSLMA